MDMYQKRKIRAEKKKEDSSKSFPSVGINWYPGHMAKTKRQISEKLNLIDIVYEVVDARMPNSSKIKDIDTLIKNKQKIMIMTKYDLCDKDETDKYITYYENMGYIVIQVNLINNNTTIILKKTNDLMQEYFEKVEKKGLKKRAIRVLVVGVPNAGKSTLINKLVGQNKAGVGSKPGFTKQLSWIRVGNNIELLDSPGVLWPKFDDQEEAKTLAALSSIKEEVVNTFEISSFIIRRMYELYPKNLEERYGISSLSEDLIEEYDLIAKKRGALKRGGLVDYEKVSKLIIQDLQSGRLGKITLDRLN